MHLEAAHAKEFTPRQATHSISGLDFAAERGSRDYDAVSLHDECAVHRQSKVAARNGLVGALQRSRN